MSLALEEKKVLQETHFKVTVTKQSEKAGLFEDFLDEFAKEISREIGKSFMEGLIPEVAMPIVRIYIGTVEVAAVFYLFLILFIYTRTRVKKIFGEA